MKAENNKMVAVHYTLTVNGEVVESSRERAPFEFILGAGGCLPAFEAAVLDQEAGYTTSIEIAPEEGYGPVHPEMIIDLPRNIFEVEGELSPLVTVGAMLPMATQDGYQQYGKVVEIKDDVVVMDFNNPMAGKTLNFDIELLSVRDVTPEDLAPKGGCGCGCGEGCGCDDEEGCGCDEGCCH